MIRKGLYALYKGVEYECFKSKGNVLELISHDPKDLDRGFLKYNDTIFTKEVSLNSVDSLFKIYPQAEYKGMMFPASDGGNGRILLDTSSAKIAEKFGFERTDKYQYSKYVDCKEVEIIEEKEPYELN